MKPIKISAYYPKIAPWKTDSDEGIMVHGMKKPEHEIVVTGLNHDYGDEIATSPNKYQIRIAMSKDPLETRLITIGLKNKKKGNWEIEPIDLLLEWPGDPINLIIMDVVMYSGNTVSTPISTPSGQKITSYNAGQDSPVTITIREGNDTTSLTMTRVPNANGSKPTKFTVFASAAFDPKVGMEQGNTFNFIGNDNLNIDVIARWDDDNPGKDDCILWVYTNSVANVAFS